MDPPNVVHISEKPWSDYTEADYTIEQWHSACLIHLHEGPPTSKSQCKLPVKTPNGALSRNGVHAAAAALAGARSPLKASPEQKAKAASALRGYYSQLDETPPDSLKQSAFVDDVVDDILEHHGVKGMKWGVRRAEKKFTKAGTPGTRANVNLKIQLHNATSDAMNNVHIPRINNKPLYVKAANDGTLLNNNHPTTKKYYDEYMNAYASELKKEASKLGASPSGKTYVVGRNEDDFLGFTVALRDVKHADSESFRVEFVKDDQGRIVGFRLVEGSITQSEEMVENVLAHFGVKGMKWGVRRKATVNPREIIVRDTRSRLPTSIKEPRIKTKGGKELPAHREAIRARTIGQKRKGSGLKTLSDQELKEYANRLQLEQNVKRLEYNELSPGKKFIRRVSGQSMQNASQSAATELGKKALKAAALA